MSEPSIVEIEFIGGPMDGPHQVHPMANYILRVPENPEGYYVRCAGKYWWTAEAWTAEAWPA